MSILKYLIYLIALLFILVWIIGFIGYSTAGITRVLLITAVITFILKFFKQEGFFQSNEQE